MRGCIGPDLDSTRAAEIPRDTMYAQKIPVRPKQARIRSTKLPVTQSQEISFEHFGLRNWNNETASPPADIGHLLNNFILQVPGKDQNIVRFGLANLVRMANRDVRPRQKHVLFVRADVHSVSQK